MLTALAIRNVVLIEQLTLTFESGLTVLTGETGAGKSILLDALGPRARRALRIRAGARRREPGGGHRRIHPAARIIRPYALLTRAGPAGRAQT